MSDQHDDGGALAEQLDRLRLVTEELQATLAAQRADGAAAERWQTRFTSLETRLSMVEGTVRAEAERVQNAARSVDAVAGSLRGALAGAEAIAGTGRTIDERIQRLDATIAAANPDLTELAADVGRRVESVVQAPTQAMTQALHEHLERSSERERAVAVALDSLTGQLNQFTATLAGEVRRAGQDASTAGRDDLRDAARVVSEASARLEGLGELSARVDVAIASIAAVGQDVADRLAALDVESRTSVAAHAAVAPVLERLGSIDAVRNDLAGVREALGSRIDANDPAESLSALHDAIAQLTNRPDWAPSVIERLDRLDPAASLAGLQSQLAELANRPDWAPSIIERLDQLDPAGSLANLQAELAAVGQAVLRYPAAVDPTPAIEALRNTIAELASRPDPAPTIEALRNTIAELANQPDPAPAIIERLDQLDPAATLGTLAALRSEVAAVSQALSQQPAPADPTEALDAVRNAIAELGSRPDLSPAILERLDHLDASAALAALRSEVAAVSQALSQQPAIADPTEALDALRHGLTELASRPDATPAILDRLDALAARPDLTATIHEHLDVIDTRSQLDGLAHELLELRRLVSQPTEDSGVDAVAAGVQALSARLDEVLSQTQAIDALSVDLQPLTAIPAALDGLGGAVEGAAAVQRRTASTVERLEAALEAVRAEVGAAAASAQGVNASLDAAFVVASSTQDALAEAVASWQAADAARDARLSDRLIGIAAALDALQNRTTPDAAIVPVLDRLASSSDAIAGLHTDLDALASAFRAVRDEVAASRTDSATAAGRALEHLTLLADLGPAVNRLEAQGSAAAARMEALSHLIDTVEQLERTVTGQSARLDAAGGIVDGVQRLESEIAALSATLGAVAGAAARAATTDQVHELVAAVETWRASLPMPVTDEALEAALAAFGRTLVAGPAPATAEELQAAVAELRDAVAAAPATDPAIGQDLRRVADELAAAIGSLPVPATPTDVHAATERLLGSLEGLPVPATPADVHDATEQLLAALQRMPAPASTGDVHAATDQLLSVLRSQPPGLRETDLDATAQAIVAGVRDALAASEAEIVSHVGAVGDRAATSAAGVDAAMVDLRAELAVLLRNIGSLEALRSLADRPDPAAAIDAVSEAIERVRQELLAAASATATGTADGGAGDETTAAQLDAIGRLVSHAVRSLHQIEAATVGISPKAENARIGATAAIRDLEAARGRL